MLGNQRIINGENQEKRSELRKVSRYDLAATCFLGLLALIVCFQELIVGMKVIDNDVIAQGIPTTAWYGQTLRDGQGFLWTPGIIGGFPLTFNQYSLFSPLDALAALLLDPDRAYAFMRAIYISLAGVSTYSYARILGLSSIPSLLAGVGYQLATDALATPAHGNGMRSLFLLPAFLLSVELVISSTPKWLLLGAAAVAFSMLTGGPQITAIALTNAALYVLIRTVSLWWYSDRKRAITLAVSAGISVLLGFGLAALRILPTTIVTSQSIRSGGTSLIAASAGSPDWIGLVAGYLVPLAGVTSLSNQDLCAPSYVGPVILILAGLAITRSRNNVMICLLTMLLAFNLLASMGNRGPIFGLMHQLPAIMFFRGAFRFSTAAAFFMSILAAIALERGLQYQGSKKQMLALFRIGIVASSAVVTLIFVAGLLWIYSPGLGDFVREYAEKNELGSLNPLRPRMGLALLGIPMVFCILFARYNQRITGTVFGVLCIFITAVLLLIVDMNTPIRESGPAQPPTTAAFLSKDKSKFRVLAYNTGIASNLILVMLSGGDQEKVNDEGPAEKNFSYRFGLETLSSSYALQYGLESIDGYEPLQSIRHMIALAYLGSSSADILSYDWGGAQKNQELANRLSHVQSRHLMEHLPVLRAFNVKYVLTNLELWNHSNDLWLAFSSQIPMLDPQSKTNIHVYEVLNVLPRAYLVPKNSVVSGPEEALQAIMEEKIDPKTTVSLEEQHLLPENEQLLTLDQSQAGIISYTNTELTVETQTNGAGYLVINDAFYPGWESWVDGQKTRILVANGWVRAIPIHSGGFHKIQLKYNPPLFMEGIWVSLASLVALVAGLIVPLPHTKYQANC